MKIGIFDSGVGGLSVLNECWHELPQDTEYLFYGDTEHVPYGLRTAQEIRGYADSAVDCLASQGVDAVIIACNTATAVAISRLRQKYTLPIIGMEPAVKPAVEKNDGRRVLVTATPVTLREEKLRNLLERVDEEHCVELLPLPELVMFAEREEFDSPAVLQYLKKQLGDRKPEEYYALVLGCTHFNYFKPAFRTIFGKGTVLVDGRRGTVRHLRDMLGIPQGEGCTDARAATPGDLRARRHTAFLLSGHPVKDADTLGHFMRLMNRLEDVREV
ncbi:MAG: glutamate racemase [Lachnospiraceae bacterium]|jgi:glutamate racemase|nr:glutamate racemase [Lachnospiraceae bacterium]